MRYKEKIFLVLLFYSIFIYHGDVVFSEENKKVEIEDDKNFHISSISIKIIPSPQEMLLKKFNIILDKSWDIIVDASNKGEYFAAKELRKELYNSHSLSLPIKKTSSISESKHKHIILGNPYENKDINSICLNRNIHLDKKFDKGGYLLEIFSDNMIVVVANNPKGIFYGVQTLKQLIKKDNELVTVTGVKIRDWPDCKIRGVHFCDSKLSEMYEIINKMSTLKMNTAIFERDLWYDFNSKQLRDSLKYEKLFSYCKTRYIEPIMRIQNLGIAFPVLWEDPHCAEGVWVQDEKFKFVNNILQPVKTSAILIENPGFETDTNGDKIPDGWLFYTEDPGCPSNYWSRDNTTSHSGNYSVKVSMHTKNTSNPLVQSLEVMPDTVYSLSCYAKKSTNNVDGPFFFKISQWNEQKECIASSWMPVTSANWQKYILNFVTQSECRKIHIEGGVWEGKGVAWFDDIELKRMNGSLVNVIRTETSDIAITNLDKTKTYVEGIDYEIKDGDMRYWDDSKGDAYPYDFTNRAPTQIKRIEGGRIAEGEAVLVSYDFILQFNRTRWKCPYCPCEPRTYEVLFEALGKLVNSSFVTDYIVIGDSEIFGMNRDSRCLRTGKTNAELLADDINSIYKFVHSIKPNVRILIYEDMLNPYHFGGQNRLQRGYGGRLRGGTSSAINLIPKDILLVIWWYDSNDYLNKMKNSPGYYKSMGFDYLVASWYDKKNVAIWADILRERKDCLGMINTNWPDTPEGCHWEGLELTANYSWNLEVSSEKDSVKGAQNK